MPDFCHLHCHTEYSLLDGASKIPKMMQKAVADNQQAIAISDHGNMFGAFKFVAEAGKHKIKPIIGCEFYLCADRHDKKDRVRYHQILLAKNAIGYKNLCKLTSLGFIEGYYYHPRIDKALILQYHEGLIASTCCLAAEIPRAIINKSEEEAEELFKWWLNLFEDDFYVELQRHGIKEQEIVNEVLIKFARKHNVKIIATNDSHYVNQEDFEAHDLLLCLQTGSDIDKPDRFKFENDQFFIKTKAEMAEAFSDIPEALDNTIEIVDKIERLDLQRDILLPTFGLPQGFLTEDDYLHHLTMKGAKSRYGELSQDVIERIQMELGIIKDMGFAGYFLIVQDFIVAARKMNVRVGPGRGSAAGSVVAYCLLITDVDPIKYNLLFERFLNPERITMPDMDIDFDDTGRQKVIDYVVDKYGRNQVAQIITFGSMAAKSSIRDVGRVLNLPLNEADRLAKMIPEQPGITLAAAFKENPAFNKEKESLDPVIRKTLKFASELEGSVRHTGVHAAGVIIAPGDLTDYVPLSAAKDSDLYVTQFEGKYIEGAGMLKMDFLGLTTLSIINDALIYIKKNHKLELDIDNLPLDDEASLQVFTNGDTIGIFQFESEGMRKYLKDLQPSSIEDLIAMNALYRPGPMDYIPEFVERKHGRKKVEYPHPLLEEILAPTYGIMVYQEQIMQTAQIIGNFSLGSADILRRAMGKKKVEVMEKQKAEFIEGAKTNNIEKDKAEEIFTIMQKFAAYGFNRSHSAAYALIAYQTAYLKAHYPAEFMAAVLTHNMSNITKVNFFIQEAKKMGIETLGPDVNESFEHFMVNDKGQIRFALSAIKGFGGAAAEALIAEREESGPFKSIFDLTKRVNLRAVNKKAIENMAYVGCFDAFEGIYRSQYFFISPNEPVNAIERAIKYGSSFQQQSQGNQQSLFGAESMAEIEEPKFLECEPWSLMELLKYEKDLTGMYISGHPLDDFKREINNFTTASIDKIENYKNRTVTLACFVNRADHLVSKKGTNWGSFIIEDYTGTLPIRMWTEKYLKFKHFFIDSQKLLIQGKYQQRYKQEGEFAFEVDHIELLAEASQKRTKHVNIQLKASELNEDLIQRLVQLCNENPGKFPLNLFIVDSEKDYKLEFFSKTKKLDINDDLLKQLDEMETIKYKLN